MAVTLEQYSLVLSANAENASRGIDSLIGSLSRLQGALASALTPLREIATTMSSIATASTSINVANIQRAATAASRGARRAATMAENAERPTQEEVREFANGFTREEALNWRRAGIENRIAQEMARPEMDQSRIGSAIIQYQNVMSQIDRLHPAPEVQPPVEANATAQAAEQAAEAGNAAAQAGEQAAQSGQEAAHAGQEAAQAGNAAAQAGQQVRNAGRQAAQAGNQAAQAGHQAQQAGEGFRHLHRNAHGASGVLGRFGRMFNSMVMRLAIRTLIKAFGEAYTAVYNFSKANNGQFAKSIDTMKSAFLNASASVVTAFAPAINALVPVVLTIASGIRVLCSAISWLFSLLGASSEFFGMSTAALDKYGKSAGGAGKANKGLLASFDELNVISKQTGGGGGGGSFGSFADMVKTQLDPITELFVGLGLMAVGSILLFTGHFGIGLSLIAIGAASAYKTTFAEWQNYNSDLQSQIAEIVDIVNKVGWGLVAIGAILLFTGHIGLGIKLLTVGLGITAATYAWKAYTGNLGDVFEEIKNIVRIGSIGAAAIGVIMLFTGHVVGGLLLIAAGGLGYMLSMSTAVSWNSQTGQLEVKFNEIKAIAGKASVGAAAIGLIMLFTGHVLPGLLLIAGGGFGYVISMTDAVKWDSQAGQLQFNFNELKKIAGPASLGAAAIGLIMLFTGHVLGGLVMIAAGGFGYVMSMNDGAIWDPQTSNLDSCFQSIKSIVTIASLGAACLGLIMLFTGHPMGGLALILAGGFGYTISNEALSFNDFTGNDGLGKVFSAIKEAVKWASLGCAALGVILLFTGHPAAGIAMILAGGLGYALSSESISFNTSDIISAIETVEGKVRPFVEILEKAWDLMSKLFGLNDNKKVETGPYAGVTIQGNVMQIPEEFESVAQYLDYQKNRFNNRGGGVHFKVSHEDLLKEINKLSDEWIINIDAAKAIDFTNWDTFTEAAKNEVITELSRKLGPSVLCFLDAKGAITVKNWDSFGKETKVGIITAITHALGDVDAVNALKNVGYTITDDIARTIGEPFYKIAQRAGIIVDTTQEAVDNKGPVTIPIELQNSIGNIAENVKNGIEAVRPKVTAEATVNVSISAELDLQTKVKNSVKAAGTAISSAISQLKAIAAHAEGAYDIPSGDLFIANEAGAELVGNIGGKTSVANNQQIIEGISNGVRDANAEQNAILRQQNDLLRELLHKELVAKVSPSSALGATVNRSLKMYAQTSGV